MQMPANAQGADGSVFILLRLVERHPVYFLLYLVFLGVLIWAAGRETK